MAGPDDALTPRPRLAAPLAALALLAAVLLAAQLVSVSGAVARSGRDVPLARVLAVSATLLAAWALVAWPVVALARRVPFAWPWATRPLLVHVAGALVTSVVQVAAAMAIRVATGTLPGLDAALRTGIAQWRASLLTNVVFYAAVVGATSATVAWRQARARAVESLAMAARLREAELAALRRQLEPHFLFNALHGISALMEQDVPRARAMLAELSDLLRCYLQEDARAEVPLREEAALLERYLRLQRMRYGDRLRATVDVADEGVLVPRLVLQPLVENALRHGADRRPGPFTLRVEGRRADGTMHLVVEDDGPGLPSDPPQGLGLANTVARLRQLHGDRAEMTLGRSPLGGARVALAFPARDA